MRVVGDGGGVLDVDVWVTGGSGPEPGPAERTGHAGARPSGAGRSDTRRAPAGDRPWSGTLAVALGIVAMVAGGHDDGAVDGGALGSGALDGGARPVAVQAPAERLPAVPVRGAVTVLDGPSSERVTVRDAAYAGDRVTAHLDVAEGTGDLRALHVDVAWYDGDGVLVGSSRHVVEPQDVAGHRTSDGVAGFPFVVAAPGGVAASLTVPAVVDE